MGYSQNLRARIDGWGIDRLYGMDAAARRGGPADVRSRDIACGFAAMFNGEIATAMFRYAKHRTEN
jgi:hypothetical protein